MESSNLRERKMLATRNSLALAAADEVLKNGIPSLHAEEIAAKVGVSTRTFHNYFPTRGDAVAYHLGQITSEWGDFLSEIPPSISTTDAVFDNLLTQFTIAGTPRTLGDAVELSSSLGLLGLGARHKFITHLLSEVAHKLILRLPDKDPSDEFTQKYYMYIATAAWETVEFSLLNAYMNEHVGARYIKLLDATSQIVKKSVEEVMQEIFSQESKKAREIKDHSPHALYSRYM